MSPIRSAIVTSGGELLAVALVAVDPADRHLIALLRDAPLAGGADRFSGSSFSSQPSTAGTYSSRKRTRLRRSRVRLAAQAEQDEVVAAQDRSI